MMISTHELKYILLTYIKSIPDGPDEEHFMTMKEYAEWQGGLFLEWIQQRTKDYYFGTEEKGTEPQTRNKE